MAVPIAAGKLVKNVKNVAEKVKNISQSLCKKCRDDDEDDYYEDDDDDDFFRFKRNVAAEVPRTVKHIIGLVKNINGRVVNRTKNVLEAGLDGARKVVGAAFGLVSKENSVLGEAGQRAGRMRRSKLSSLEQAKALLGAFLMDLGFTSAKVYQSASAQLQIIFATLRELFHIIWKSIFDSRVNSSWGQTLSEVKRVILDVSQKLQVQVLKTLQDISRFVQAYKSKLERGRRSLDGVKSIWKRNVTEQANQTTDNRNQSSVSPPTPDSSSKPSVSPPDSPPTSSPNPVVKGMNDLATLTDNISQVMDLVSDLTDIFSFRRKREIEDEDSESKVSLDVFIEEMENGTLQVLAKTKDLMGRTIQKMGQSIDLGLQRISSALSRQRKSADDQLEDVRVFLRELPKEISLQMKKWIENPVLLNGKLFQIDGNDQESLRAIKKNIDVLRGVFDEFLTGFEWEGSEEVEETNANTVEREDEKVVSRKRRFVIDTLVGMLVAKATSAATNWIYETANYLASGFPESPQISNQDLNTNSRTKRESDKSLLGEIIGLPGKILDGVIQRGKKRADALRKIIVGDETNVDSDNLYPGRR